MTGQSLAFYFDAAACSGCRTCQVACKDHHTLTLGLRWRRVYEITSGDWTRRGAAWVADVSAFNLSIGCNHCDRPICLEGCPTGAIRKREDGIVLIDGHKCVGCRYCSWACPYGAPQYDPQQGCMTKCTFCAERLDQEQLPICVAACPLRALDFSPREALENKHGPIVHISPLPPADRTDPSLVISAHRDAARTCELPADIVKVTKS